MSLRLLLIFLSLKQCYGVIHHLNDSEYHRMPPLSSLDIYDECLHEPGGLYCLAHFHLVADSQNEVMKLIRDYSANGKKHFNHTNIERGICVTKSCLKYIKRQDMNKTENVNMIIEACVNSSIWNVYGVQAKLANVYYCNRDKEETEIDSADWFYAGIIFCFIILNFLGTYCDIFCVNNNNNKAKRDIITEKLILNFSIRANWQWLTMSEPTDPRANKLKSIHSLKVVGILMTIISHVIFFNASTFNDNTHDFEKTYESTHYQVIYNGTNFIQLFFVLSGFLMIYTLEMKTEDKKITWNMYPKIMFLRWWRLSAAYAVVLGFSATWLRHLGSGPLWKYRVNSISTDCRRNWWLHLLHINNYVETESTCAPNSWTTAAEFQLFAIGLVVYLLTRNRGRNIALFLLFFIGITTPAIHVWLQDLDGAFMMTPEFLRTLESDSFRWLYVPGHVNISGFVVGMYMGYLIYNMKISKPNKDLLNNKESCLLALCIVVLIYQVLLIGRVFFVDGVRPSLAASMIYASTHRLVASTIAAFIIAALVIKVNGAWCRLFEWRGWAVLGRLSFGVYLIHLQLISVLVGRQHSLGHVSYFYMITMYFAVVSMSFVMALPFYLVIEAPLGRLLYVLMVSHKELMKKS